MERSHLDRCRAEGYALQGLPWQDWRRLQCNQVCRRCHPVRTILGMSKYVLIVQQL